MKDLLFNWVTPIFLLILMIACTILIVLVVYEFFKDVIKK